MIISDYICVYFDDLILKYAVMVNKPIIFIRSYGWNNCENQEKIVESKKVYKQSLPLDVYTTMEQSEFSFIEIESVEEALEFCEDNFPESTDKCEPEFYVHYKVFNGQGHIIASN